MKKILVVFTGGTIGSVVKGTSIDVSEDKGYQLIEDYRKTTTRDVTFDTIQPFTILSENCQPMHWYMLAQALKEAHYETYDGVIITHGSDTLPYTSAAMGYGFAMTSVPILLTASNYPLGEPGSNGAYNFASAVEYICQDGPAGVFTVFADAHGVARVYIATRLLEADPVRDQFTSFDGKEFGHIEQGEMVVDRALPQEGIRVNVPSRFDDRILSMQAYPGLDYEMFHFQDTCKPRAIIHGLYHSATGCDCDGAQSLPRFIKRCSQWNIHVYLISFKENVEKLYVTSQALLEAGAIPLSNISMEAATVKAWFAYNQTKEEPQKYMKQAIYHEFL